MYLTIFFLKLHNIKNNENVFQLFFFLGGNKTNSCGKPGESPYQRRDADEHIKTRTDLQQNQDQNPTSATLPVSHVPYQKPNPKTNTRPLGIQAKQNPQDKTPSPIPPILKHSKTLTSGNEKPHHSKESKLFPQI